MHYFRTFLANVKTLTFKLRKNGEVEMSKNSLGLEELSVRIRQAVDQAIEGGNRNPKLVSLQERLHKEEAAKTSTVTATSNPVSFVLNDSGRGVPAMAGSMLSGPHSTLGGN